MILGPHHDDYSDDIEFDDGSTGDDGEWLHGLRERGLPVLAGRTPQRVHHELTLAAADLVDRARASSTVTAYEGSWRAWHAWCAAHGLDPYMATPADVCDFIAGHVTGGLSLNYLQRHLAAITAEYDAQGIYSPVRAPIVRQALAGATRTHGNAPRRAAPLTLEQLRHMITAMPMITRRPHTDSTLRRDRALLLVGWYGALRASSLVGLDVDDVRFHGDPDRPETGSGALLRLRGPKGRPGQDLHVAIPYGARISACPVRSLMILTRLQRTGPVFRHIDRHDRQHGRLNPKTVTDIVRRHLAAVDVDPGLYTSHSLRAGWVTEARQRGLHPADIMRHTHHRDARMLAVYDRPDNLLDTPAARAAGEW
ncbi:MAG: hypothetical protein ABMA25_14085 [Ilumatobacteraceae bacterium]